MKFKEIGLILIVLFSINLNWTLAQPKAKKPRIVVVPSDALLNHMGLLGSTDDMGVENYIEDYKHAFLDTDLKGCIAKISEMFNDRGFPLTMLEAELRRVQGKILPVVIDYRLELNYRIKQYGPRKTCYFELTAIDAYSSKQVAGTSGESKPAIGESTINLLQEAVLSQIDKFAADMQAAFEKIMQNGRESRLTITAVNGASLDVDKGKGSVIDIVETWLDQNCVNGSYSTDSQDGSTISISQAMMPVFQELPNGNQKALDARNFYKSLVTTLKVSGFNAKNVSGNISKSNSVGGILGDGSIEIDL